MNLQTIVDIPKPGFELSYKDKGLFVGSCFATSLEAFLSYRKADVSLCPYGEMYNPVSISSFFTKYEFTEEDIVNSQDGLWYSWYHHGSVYSDSKEGLLKKINSIRRNLNEINYLVLTLGTSWVYELSDGRIVSNCHKMLSSLFLRRSLSLEEIMESLRTIVSSVSKAQVIITVSPIRHIKDGLAENSYSKSLLRVAASLLQKENNRVYYYPSYEIMNDELRDYRFYREDMIHPTDQASSYIMEKFVEIAFEKKSKEFFKDVAKLRLAASHIPLHVESKSYQSFRDYQGKLLDELIKRYPEVDFSDVSFAENV